MLNARISRFADSHTERAARGVSSLQKRERERTEKERENRACEEQRTRTSGRGVAIGGTSRVKDTPTTKHISVS